MNLVNAGHIMPRVVSRALLTVLIISLCANILYGAGDDFFLRQEIDVAGMILGSHIADFDGDGLNDLVLLVQDPGGRRSIRSHIQRESGRFPPVATQIIEISSSANMAQSLDLNGDGRMELYLIDSQGLWLFEHDGGQFDSKGKSLITTPTLFASGIEGGLIDQDCIYMISGRPIAFLPVAAGYSLWEYDNGRFGAVVTLGFPHFFSVVERPVKLFGSSNHGSHGLFQICLPEVVIGDSNGDDLDDIYLIWPDRVDIIVQNARNSFDVENRLSFRFQALSEGNLCQSRLVDYDRDGRLDIVCSRSAGGISGARTDINFFHSTQIQRLDQTGNHVVSLTDACGNLMIDDFNKSGRPDLVIPAIELGIMSTVKKMVTKKTDLHILIYPIDNLGRPAREPKVRKKIPCRLDFEFADPTANIRIDWSGDYDGDGLADLVVADGGGQLMFYRGKADEYLEDKASLILDLANPDRIRPIHINDDAASDLIIIHKPEEGMTRLTMLVTNRIS